MKAALYLRVSSAQQAEGASLDEQEKALRSYADAHGLDVVAVFQEAASSWHGTRTAYDLMLAGALAGEFERVLVWSLDRFARKQSQLHADTERMEKAGCYLILMRPPVDFSAGDYLAVIMKSALGMSAELENHIRAERARMVTVHQRELGLFRGGITPLGYKRTGHRFAPCEIDETHAATVRRMFELYATGTHSFISLAHQLAAEGHTLRNGKPIRFMILSRLMNNRRFTGYGNEPAIISEELFERCQQVMSERAGAPRSVARSLHVGLLRGVGACWECRQKLYQQVRETATYYRCRLYGFDGCQSGQRSVREDAIAPQIDRYIRAIRPPVEWREAIEHMLAKDDSRRVAVALRDSVAAKLTRLADLYVDGLVSRVEYDSRRAALEGELRSIVVPGVETLTAAGEMVESLATVWKQATIEEKNRLLRALFRKVFVDLESGEVAMAELHPEIGAVLGV